MKNCFRIAHARLLPLGGFFLLATAALAASRGWVIYESPNTGQTNVLTGVSAVSAAEAWAVGYAYDASSQQVAITQHWNGASWSAIASPNPGTAQECGGASYAGNELAGVEAISASDVWAVGHICGPGTSRTLAMHWDGNGWSVVPSPNKSLLDDSELSAVSAIASNDIWAVGNYQVAFQYQWETFIEHWDGTAWSIVPSPNPSGSQITYLTGVSALAPNDVWAVGYQNVNQEGQNGQGLILHWDGAAWSQIESPIAGYATILLGVTANSSNDINAVGYIQTRNVQYKPVTEHWNGTRWTVVKVATPGRVGQLWSAAVADGSTWAVGAYSLVPMTQGYMEDPATLILKNR